MDEVDEHERRSRPIRQVLAASFVGTTIERYDYFLVGSAAALMAVSTGQRNTRWIVWPGH